MPGDRGLAGVVRHEQCFEWVFVTQRNLGKLFGRHPGGTRVTRLFLVPWIHCFQEEHFSPRRRRLG